MIAVTTMQMEAPVMASITVRNLEDGLKRRLRIRAAENGRSMEQESKPGRINYHGRRWIRNSRRRRTWPVPFAPGSRPSAAWS